MIYSFKRLVYKKGFFPGNPMPILYIGWPLVWALWVIVTIVYSEVILGLFFVFYISYLIDNHLFLFSYHFSKMQI